MIIQFVYIYRKLERRLDRLAPGFVKRERLAWP